MYYNRNPYNKRNNPYDSNRRNYYQGRYRVRDSKDQGPNPFATNIREATLHNNTFRTALWTGDYLQLTLMRIDVNDDIGLEMHPYLDQFLRLEQGQGLVIMGKDKNDLSNKKRVAEDYVIIIPAGTWHNLINTGNVPIKLYSIYAPPNHPHGTIHVKKEDEDH